MKQRDCTYFKVRHRKMNDCLILFDKKNIFCKSFDVKNEIQWQFGQPKRPSLSSPTNHS